MKTSLRVLWAAAVVMGCGSDDDEGGSEGESEGEGDHPAGFVALPQPDNGLQFVTPPLTFAPGEDREVCIYTNYYFEQETLIRDALARQMRYGHHLVVYGSTSDEESGHHTCTGAEQTSNRFLAFPLQMHEDGTMGPGRIILPEGVGTIAPAGLRVMINAHYINASSEELVVQDRSTSISPSGEVEQTATRGLGPDVFTLPQGYRTTIQHTCRVPRT